MGARRIRREQVQADQKTSRRENGILKTKERVRRDLRMLGLVKKGPPPYTPAVMTWLSERLGKPSSSITKDDLAKVTK